MRTQRTIPVVFLDHTIVYPSWGTGLHPWQVHSTTVSYPEMLFFKMYTTLKLATAVPSYNTTGTAAAIWVPAEQPHVCGSAAWSSLAHSTKKIWVCVSRRVIVPSQDKLRTW